MNLIELSELANYTHNGSGRYRKVKTTTPLLLNPNYIVSIQPIDIGCRIRTVSGDCYEVVIPLGDIQSRLENLA